MPMPTDALRHGHLFALLHQQALCDRVIDGMQRQAGASASAADLAHVRDLALASWRAPEAPPARGSAAKAGGHDELLGTV
jgi:hypothetical protein